MPTLIANPVKTLWTSHASKAVAGIIALQATAVAYPEAFDWIGHKTFHEVNIGLCALAFFLRTVRQPDMPNAALTTPAPEVASPPFRPVT